MASLPRKTQLIFGQSLVPNGNVAQFGSLASGAAAYSNDPALIQTSQWLLGLAGALVGNRSPTLEDLNGVLLVITQQLAYIFQNGLPEWDANTTYWNFQIVRIPGTSALAISRSDNNLNNNPATDSNNWDTSGISSAIQVSTVGETSVPIDSAAHIVVFAGTGWNPRAAYNTGTGVFTVPVTGLYEVQATIQLDNNGATPTTLDGFVRLIDTGTSGTLLAAGWSDSSPVGNRWYPQVSQKVFLTSGQTVALALGGVSAGGGAVKISNSVLSISRVP